MIATISWEAFQPGPWWDVLRSIPLPKVLVAISAAGVPVLMIEMGYGHFRGNFRRPSMYVPVLVPPLFAASAVVLLLTDAAWALLLFAGMSGLLALMGGVGVALHVQGIHRRPGGISLPNIMTGPPALAPLGFAALGLLGLLALLYWSG